MGVPGEKVLVLLLSTLVAASSSSREKAPPPAPAGLYQIEPGHLVGFTVFGDGRVVFTDFSKGEGGRLTPLGRDQYVARRGNGDTISVRVVGAVGSNPIRIVWSETGEPPRRIDRIEFPREQVRIVNGDVKLGGTLVLPRGRGRFPVVVRLHGAGPADRTNTIDEYFAQNGVAFFSYDKRGVGTSTGDWRQAGVEDLAADAAAAIAFLAKHPEIDGHRIGVGGGSEGGWVAAAVTGRVPDLAFAFLLAGPALSFPAELMEEAETGLRRMGVNGSDLERALAFQRWKIERIRAGDFLTDQGWAAIEAGMDSVRAESWFQALAPWSRDSWRWQKFRQMMSFDPAPFWERYRGPLLALYGGQDTNVPAERNADALRMATERAHNRDARVEIVPAADHDGLDSSRQDGDIVSFAPGYLDVPLKWVLERTHSKNN